MTEPTVAAVEPDRRDFFFHGTRLRIHVRTPESGGAYALIEMWHPPNVGPALHIHPRGAESFLVLAGSYTFTRGVETAVATAGTSLVVPPDTPHRYSAGPEGGHLIVVSPPGLERYFEQASVLSAHGPIPLDEEIVLASRWGQDFLDRTAHWEPR